MSSISAIILRRLISRFIILPGHEDYSDSLRRVQILRVVILFVGSFDLLVLLTLPLVVLRAQSSIIPILLAMLPYYGLLLLMSRPPYLRIASWGVVLSAIWVIFSIYLNNMYISADLVLNFLIIPMIIACILLTLKETLLTLLLIAAGILMMPFTSAVSWQTVYVSLLFNVFCGILIMVVTWLGVFARDLLRESENRYRALMEASLESIILADTHGCIIDANPASVTLMGKPLDQLRGTYMVQYLADSERARAQEFWSRRVAEPFEISFFNGQNKHIIAEIVIRPYEYMGAASIVVTGRDITQHKEAERIRREALQRYEALFTQTSDAVFLLDLEGRYIDVNDVAKTMFRVKSPEEIMNAELGNYVAPEEIADSFKVMERLLAGEQVPLYERQFVRKGGAVFVGEVDAMLVRDLDGKPAYIQSIVRDTTERKRAERQKFELALQQERVRVLQRFIDDVSHHFRTPITKLKTSAYLLPRFMNRPDKQKDHFRIFETELAQLDRLLEDLLTIVRLEKEETGQYNYKRFELKETIQQVVDAYRSRSGETVRQFSFSLHPSPLMILGDPPRLGQAISNLIDNAILYTPANGRIDLAYFLHDGFIVIDIRDNGIGVSEIELPHIFENFYRSDSARVEHPYNVGLGLSIVAKIVQMHRGLIRVSSQTDVGSIFQIILPQAHAWEELKPESIPTIVHLPTIAERSEQVIRSN